jgi:hypothetical protein
MDDPDSDHEMTQPEADINAGGAGQNLYQD